MAMGSELECWIEVGEAINTRNHLCHLIRHRRTCSCVRKGLIVPQKQEIILCVIATRESKPLFSKVAIVVSNKVSTFLTVVFTRI